MVGGPSADCADTVMVKVGSEALEVPLLAVILMLAYAPTSAAAGVPDSSPVAVLKFAQEGSFCIENVRACPCGSVAVGLKLYAVPAVTAVAGVPLIVGGPSAACAATVIVKAGSEALAVSLLAVMMMLA